MNEITYKEQAYTLFGVEGRMFNRVQDTVTGLYRNQTWGASRPFNEPGYKAGSVIHVSVSFDDNCNNKEMSFAITGHVKEPGVRDWSIGGCIHEEIAKYFPELAHLIKWHLTGTGEPMHYVANAAYHATNCDYNGYAAGEPCQWETKVKFGSFPISFKLGKTFREWLKARFDFNATTLKTNPDRVEWSPVAVQHDKKPGDTYDFDPKYTLNGFDCKWHECPFDTLNEAQEFIECLTKYEMHEVKIVTAYSKGKERDLPAARRAAIWPEATDSQLCLPRKELEELLKARLPALMAEFKADMLACGFDWKDSQRSK